MFGEGGSGWMEYVVEVNFIIVIRMLMERCGVDVGDENVNMLEVYIVIIVL